jgi:hypothetical protein
VSDDGQIKHNGSLQGFLYVVAESIKAGDVISHPRTTMGLDDEWLTTRELRVQLLCPSELVTEEQLTEVEIAALQKRLVKQVQSEKRRANPDMMKS